MRYVRATVLFVVAVAAGLLSEGALQNLWADYQDSPTSTYLEVGLLWLVIGLAALFAAVRTLRRH